MTVRNMTSGVLAAAAIALGSGVLAQTVPSQFVVSGKADVEKLREQIQNVE